MHYAAAAIANFQARKPPSEQTKRVPNPAGSRAELHPSAVKSHVSVELTQPHSHPELVPLNRLMTTCPPSARPSLTNYLLYEGSTAARLEPASEKKKEENKCPTFGRTADAKVVKLETLPYTGIFS